MFKQATLANMLDVINSPDKQLVVFSSPFCAPCDAMKRRIKLEGIDAWEVNITEEIEIATDLGIDATPTIMLFQNGQLLNVADGILTAKELGEFMAGVHHHEAHEHCEACAAG